MRIEAREGRTLAEVLREELGGISWNRARELCRRGKVHVNGQLATDPALRLQSGDEVAFEAHAPRIKPELLPWSAIVHVDRQLVVVSKPAGMMSVPFDAGDRDTLVDRVRVLLRQRDGVAGSELGVVQRLDKDTSGLLVFARTLVAKRHLQQQFRKHSIERRYRALVHGALLSPHDLESDLIQDRGDGLRGSWGHYRKPRNALPRDAQHALTRVRPLEVFAQATLVECQLETGRQHQIRIHLSELGHPLLGETVYIRDYKGPRVAAPRLMLHAGVLGFAHPANEQPMRFELEFPGDMAQVLAAQGKSLQRP